VAHEIIAILIIPTYKKYKGVLRGHNASTQQYSIGLSLQFYLGIVNIGAALAIVLREQ